MHWHRPQPNRRRPRSSWPPARRATPPTPLTTPRACPRAAPLAADHVTARLARLRPEVQGRLRHALDCLNRSDGCFVGARGGDHVDHLYDDVDVRELDVPLGVGIGMTWLVHERTWSLVLHDG